MPGLIRGVARTAVVAGTASAVAGRVQRHQAEKFADRDQAIASNRGYGYAEGVQEAEPLPPAAAPPPAQDNSLSELKQLAELKDQGIITEEEFAAKKKQILGI